MTDSDDTADLPQLAEAPPTSPGDVVDGHTHLFALPMLEEYVVAHPEENQRWQKAVKERRFGRRGEALPEFDPETMARWYAKRIHDAGVAKAVVMSVIPDSQYARDFIVAARGHVAACAYVDPGGPDAPARLEREIAAGFRGVKLLPVNRKYFLSDEEYRPFFYKAAELGTTVVIHYGVTVDPSGDMRYANPLDLSPVARDFPEITFVIAHFGAGFLGEVLRLAYQCSNVCVDSSGTNNWMDFDPHGFTLSQVFDRTLTALGPQRVIFGTDAGTTAPYRQWIKFQQTRILEELGLSDEVRDAILRANAVRVFRLDEEAV